jgi:hypothetical protein
MSAQEKAIAEELEAQAKLLALISTQPPRRHANPSEPRGLREAP